jgi:hypothetical protein
MELVRSTHSAPKIQLLSVPESFKEGIMFRSKTEVYCKQQKREGATESNTTAKLHHHN